MGERCELAWGVLAACSECAGHIGGRVCSAGRNLRPMCRGRRSGGGMQAPPRPPRADAAAVRLRARRARRESERERCRGGQERRIMVAQTSGIVATHLSFAGARCAPLPARREWLRTPGHVHVFKQKLVATNMTHVRGNKFLHVWPEVSHYPRVEKPPSEVLLLGGAAEGRPWRSS